MAELSEGNVFANGINIHYHRTGSTNKPSILLLHGITDSGLCWSRVALDLAGSYDIIMTDARGHGHSDGLATGFSTNILADDAAAFIRALHLEKPYLFGHSMGAITAATVAAKYPDLVRAIVIEDPPLVDRPPVQTDNEQTDQQGWQRVIDLKVLTREERIARGFAMNPGWVAEEIIPWADSKAEFNTDVLTRATFLNDPWREVISRIDCPILLIIGDPELHAIVTSKVAQEAAQLWKNGEVIHISGAGHNIHRDRYNETIAAVRAFLNRV